MRRARRCGITHRRVKLFQILFENSASSGGPELRKIGEAARHVNCTAVMGIHERKGGSLYNSLVYLSASGEIAGIHRKLTPSYNERLIWGRRDKTTLEAGNPQGWLPIEL